MWRHVAANALTFFVVALFLAAGAILWGVNRWSAPGPLAQAICLRVESGSTMRRVADELGQKGALASPAVFRIGTDYAGLVPQLKAGSYLIPEGASMEQIASIVTRGGANTCGTEIVWRVGVTRTVAQVRDLDPASGTYVELAAFDPLAEAEPPAAYAEVRARPDTTYRVVVAEGTTSWQVVQALNAIDVLEGDAEDIPAEGTLAPRDYPLAPGTTVETILAQMADIQSRILSEAWENRAPDLPFDTPEEALTLASIVEKETAIAEERPVVASVLVNRLRRGDMRLQFDPTIIYGITRGQGVLDRPIRQSDIAGETERRLHGAILYNTYQIDGLPAGPIANPGRAAIEAAVNPAATDYLFFVADGTGGHAFAATLEEHNRNVARLRALEAEQAAARAAQAAEAPEGEAAPTP
jgi:UPF0755 protein